MAENCKDPRASAQTPLGGFTVATTNLHNFHFVKTINALYGLPHPLQSLRPSDGPNEKKFEC